MRVLVSAYACEPDCGSEPAIGWNVVRGLSRHHKLTVMTRANNERAIRASSESWVESVDWVFLDPPRWLTFWKRKRSGVRLFYLIWQVCAYLKGWKLKRRTSFDLVHHLTFASIFPASPLAFLGLPFVAGPLGGAQEAPAALRETLPPRLKRAACWQKWSRKLVATVSLADPVYRRSQFCLGATKEAVRCLQSFGARRVDLQVQSGLSANDLTHLRTLTRSSRDEDGPLRILVASRMVFWKGVDLALEAVAKARDKGLSCEVQLSEDGPEKKNLQDLVSRRRLGSEVTFLGRLPGHEDFLKILSESDVLLHPAFAESFGQVCLEALGCGVPVICLNWGGPGVIVDNECGYLVEVGKRDEVITGLAEALLRCQRDRLQGVPRTELLHRRAEDFHWERLISSVEAGYGSVARPTF